MDDDSGIKVTLIGNSGVGKTCIITRYTDDVFNENSASTIGANFIEKKINIGNKEYNLNIWDTAGQEKYQSLGKHFYKDSYIVCLVYDITNQESLDSLKSVWYPNLQKYGEQYSVLAVVGNKIDLYENVDDLADEEQAKQFAKEINATFIQTSAKNGDGIDNLFTNLTKKLLENPKFNDLMKGKGLSLEKDANTTQKKKKFCSITFLHK
jgi:small GTP-binding protein